MAPKTRPTLNMTNVGNDISAPIKPKRTPPPPPPRIKSSAVPIDPILKEKAAIARVQRQRAVAIAAAEFAHTTLRRPIPSQKVVIHATDHLMHVGKAEVLDIMMSTTDGDHIASLVTQLISQCAQEAFRAGVQHERSKS